VLLYSISVDYPHSDGCGPRHVTLVSELVKEALADGIFGSPRGGIAPLLKVQSGKQRQACSIMPEACRLACACNKHVDAYFQRLIP